MGTAARQQIQLGAQTQSTSVLYAVGKAAAGRILDGRTWDEFPRKPSTLATLALSEQC
jgi:protein gp37